MVKITEEIELLRKKLGYSQVAMAEILDVTDKTYSKKVANHESFSYEGIDNLINFLLNETDVDVGSFLKEFKRLSSHLNMIYFEDNLLDDNNVNKSNMIHIPCYQDIRSSAGFGAINGNIAKPEDIMLPKSLIPSASKKTEAIKCCGDSMSPSLEDGDIMFVDRVQIDINDGDIYVLRVEDELFVKKLFRVPGRIIARSDNVAYPDFDLIGDNFEILGKVIYRMERV